MTFHTDSHVEDLLDGPRTVLLQAGALGSTTRKPYRDFAKRGFDVVAVLLCSLPIVVLIGLLALIIQIQGGRPFYVQERVGRGNRVYQMWKLRTMVVDADKQLARHLEADEDAQAEWARTQKLKNDPRITRFGRFLRRTSLDELPQLWNVLIGDMSLVGPRPMMPDQRAMYPGQAYYRLRPGITGPWQVSDRNETSFADRSAYDNRYEQDVSLRHDIGLLAATVRVVVRATGY
ncbi:sugar transferase [Flavimaricola marinus]|uniref:Undecaprenyl phosphate N,N'-diacetylbacillosamine 1-phosphate transferase n=1 Tax=Flavimaricola marinus TaxID=1819565 RepID=A0A238LI36_9RHOB|nr:sugar transferase [Flavimaricola marinus]SMY09288.1 Undecaprenyl phosphate N,N'-diacetylbacillosamine 1-phosphate transferase [Flavimaricola marinus]